MSMKYRVRSAAWLLLASATLAACGDGGGEVAADAGAGDDASELRPDAGSGDDAGELAPDAGGGDDAGELAPDAGGEAYSIGGTVSGLNGTVVLRNNGADDLVVNEDGAFVFPTQVEKGGAYDVSIHSRPPYQRCEVAAGSGTADAAVTDVAVSCADKIWHHPADLASYFTSVDAGAPMDTADFSVAMAPNGNAIVAWFETEVVDPGAHPAEPHRRVYFRHRQGGVWGEPQVASPDGSDASWAHAALAANGEAVIAWSQLDSGGSERIFVSEYDGSSWTHPADLDAHTGELAGSPRVAMSDDGDVVIAWRRSELIGGDWDSSIVAIQRRTGIWQSHGKIDPPDGLAAYNVDVAMDAAGDAIIVWDQDDGTAFRIYKSEWRAGTWYHPSLADYISVDGTNAQAPAVAMGSGGTAIIVWQQNDGANAQVFASLYSEGSWSHPTGLADNISPDGSAAGDVNVAMSATGAAVVAYRQLASDGYYQVFVSEYSGGTWQLPADLGAFISPTGQHVFTSARQMVAMDSHGGAIVTWYQPGATAEHVFKSEYRNGTWRHPSSLEDYVSPDGSDPWDPVAVMSDNGDALLVFPQSADYGGDEIFVSQYY